MFTFSKHIGFPFFVLFCFHQYKVVTLTQLFYFIEKTMIEFIIIFHAKNITDKRGKNNKQKITK